MFSTLLSLLRLIEGFSALVERGQWLQIALKQHMPPEPPHGGLELVAGVLPCWNAEDLVLQKESKSA